MADSVDWGRYNLPAIWAMMKDEDVCDGADRVLAWDTLSQDVRDQHQRLLAAKDKLAEVWPPESNASARIFLEQVSNLAASMNDTLTAAEDTRVGLQGILTAIATAQSTLSPIVQQRQAKSTDFIPRFVDHAEDDYDKAGQQAMRVAEAAIQDHGTQITVPPLYRLHSQVGGSPTDLPDPGDNGSGGSGSGGGSLTAVPIPVSVPHNPADFGTGNASNPSGSNPSGGSPTGGSTGSGDGGLGLAGVLPLAPSTPAGLGGTVPALGVTPSAGGLPGGVSAGGLPGVVIGGGAFGLGSGGSAGGGFSSGSGLGLRTGSGGGREPVSIRRGLPSGATIGAQQSEGGLAGQGLTGQGSPAGGGAGDRGRRTGSAENESISGEADLRWGVRSGVAPVIEPDMTPVRHDPGPGIIGSDA